MSLSVMCTHACDLDTVISIDQSDACLQILLSCPWVSKPGGNPSFKNGKSYPGFAPGVTHRSRVN